jgi:8-oxo-dGTP diphosphatase
MKQASTIRVVAAMIEEGGRYLITQRRPAAVLPLLWEFPGGKVEVGESDLEALAREVLHRLGVNIGVGKLISFVRHPYERYTIDLHLYECHLTAGRPEKLNVHDFAWVPSDEFEHYTFTPADEISVAKLLGIGG